MHSGPSKIDCTAFYLVETAYTLGFKVRLPKHVMNTRLKLVEFFPFCIRLALCCSAMPGFRLPVRQLADAPADDIQWPHHLRFSAVSPDGTRAAVAATILGDHTLP